MLTINARSLGSAVGFFVALSRFHPEAAEHEDGTYSVAVALGSDTDIVAVLHALAQHVTARGDGPARVELDGRRYSMPPTEG
jgi:hypothetical protein